MEICHLPSEQRLASIKVQLARLGIQLQAPTVQVVQPYCIQLQAVPLLEQGAADAGPPPPPVPPPSKHIYNVTPSLPSQQQDCYYQEMVADKAPPPAKFGSTMNNLEAWILQMDANFTVAQTCN